MARVSTLALRRLAAKRKIVIGGTTHYADATEVGTIIDRNDDYIRSRCPITLERFTPAYRPPSAALPNGLMANPVVPATWEVVECFADLDAALPRAAAAKQEPSYKGATLRVRDRRDNTVIMCAILG
jgi:hypothetical protein